MENEKTKGKMSFNNDSNKQPQKVIFSRNQSRNII